MAKEIKTYTAELFLKEKHNLGESPFSVGGFKSGNKVLAWFAGVAFLLMFLGAAGSAAVPREYFGIVERFSTYSAVCFTAVIAVIAFFKFGKSITQEK